jgi:hypothetical protein
MNGPGSGSAAADVAQTCNGATPGNAIVRLTWQPPGENAIESWVELSLTEDFLEGTFQVYGPIAPARAEFTLGSAPLGVTFHYRVKTKTPGGWDDTATGDFIVDCARPPIAGDVTQTCAPAGGPGAGTVAVTFTWQQRAPGPQYIDLTTHTDAFAADAYASSAPIAERAESYTWPNMTQGIRYHYRIRVDTPEGHMTSDPQPLLIRAC